MKLNWRDAWLGQTEVRARERSNHQSPLIAWRQPEHARDSVRVEFERDGRLRISLRAGPEKRTFAQKKVERVMNFLIWVTSNRA